MFIVGRWLWLVSCSCIFLSLILKFVWICKEREFRSLLGVSFVVFSVFVSSDLRIVCCLFLLSFVIFRKMLLRKMMVGVFEFF